MNGPSLQEMAEVLVGCPELERLEVAQVIFSSESTEYIEKIPLLKLRRLDLDYIAAGVINGLCSVIQTPNCSRYSLRPQEAADSSFEIVRNLVGPHLCAFLAINHRKNNGSLHVGITRTSVHVSAVIGIGGERLEVGLHSIGPIPEVVEWAIGFAHTQPNGRHLSLSFASLHPLTLPGTLSLLRCVPTLSSVTFQGCDNGMDEILKELGAPRATTTKGRVKEWLCPNLTFLTLCNCGYSHSSSLLAMVRGRLRGSKGLKVAAKQKPVRFSQLRIEGSSKMDEDTFKALQHELPRKY
ncbi:hypothetical protein FRB94_005076 [Tulasnella sp. JGI-2019a]|nr:hypothetical protein FRB93_009622 [Tulasnella sp. JGI-2019a]KAG9000960.1 hypothetical protein FRB94_005076 [Tulasnella sp. JGI-2019a]